jgi:hypothetical protein
LPSAVRARCAEGKLQVELAQLPYLLPRLVGQWTHLERLGGGIGTRGPGETQLESDRRVIRNRVMKIRRELGWQPRETFDTGLRRTVEWYLANQEWCQRVQSGAYRRERLGLGTAS